MQVQEFGYRKALAKFVLLGTPASMLHVQLFFRKIHPEISQSQGLLWLQWGAMAATLLFANHTYARAAQIRHG